MVKLGPCSIIIEPHHFEVMLYIVKGNEVKQQQQQQQQRQTAQPSITTTTTTTTTTHKKQIQQNQQQRQIQQPVMQSGQGLQYQLPQHSQQQTFHQYQPPGQAIQPAPATTAPPPPSHSAAASAPMPTSHGHGHPQSPTYQQGTNPEPLVVQNTNMTASQPQPTPPPLQQQQQQQQQQRQTYTGHSAQQSQHQQQQQHLPPQAQNQLPRTQPAPAPAPAAASQPQLQPQSRPQQQPQQRPPLQPAHPHPTPHQQQQQRISQPPNQQHSQQQPLPPPPPPPKTAQDPVIQMLATRAAADPDLKALMQLVASKRADQSQLRKFQAHIDELHAIIAQRSREAAAAIVQQQQRRQQQQQQQQVQAQQRKPPRQQQQGDANMVIYSPAQSTGGAAPLRSLPQAQAQAQPQPQPLSSQPQQQQQQQQQKYQGYQAAPGATPSSASSHNQGQKGHLTQVLPSTVAYQQQPKHHQQQQQQQRQQPHKPPRAHAPALPKVEPKAVVFEFLTPSSTQIAAAGVVGGNSHSHVSAGDRYLFPANTILDYFPGGTTVIASFLAIKKVDEREPYVDLSVRGNVRGKYQKKSKKEKENEKKDGKDAESSRAQTATAETETEGGSSAAFIEKETGEKKLVNRDGEGSSIKEYYQPVTMRLHASHLRILEPLAKIVNPPAQVRKYMDDVMDRLPRADIEYLALRLPREGSAAAKTEE
ncbi:hypothetical protein KEM54_000798 [Ascosphaera aggregata]|nr:hypothetical protein KEM54_000798 [Ascosphaera aggregata]